MKIGVQLYSVREHMAKDPLAAMKDVIEAGFTNWEAANASTDKDPGIGFGLSADEVKAELAKLGARIVSAHLYPLRAGEIAPILDFHKAIGTQYIALPMEFYVSADDVKRKAENMNAVGKECKAAGIQFAYHNHFHEFQQIDGKTIYDIVMENTDPEYVKIELDTYWVMRAGLCPAETLKKYGKRVCLIHQKDYTKGYEDQMNVLEKCDKDKFITMEDFMRLMDMKTFTEIGTGTMNIQGIIDTAAEYCDVEYLILEQDASQMDAMESIRVSRKNLEKYSGLTF